jgi:uncharacterized membrane protein YccC
MDMSLFYWGTLVAIVIGLVLTVVAIVIVRIPIDRKRSRNCEND